MKKLEIFKYGNFKNIYQAECFRQELNTMFKGGENEKIQYQRWLLGRLMVLDRSGFTALQDNQFRVIKGTKNPKLYEIRHPNSKLNERYVYVYMDNSQVVLLTGFLKKSKSDINRAIKRANSIYNQLNLEED